MWRLWVVWGFHQWLNYLINWWDWVLHIKLKGEKVRWVQIKTERKQNSAQGRLSVPNTENSFLTSNSLLYCLLPPCHQWWALSAEWQSTQRREWLTVTYDHRNKVTKRGQFTTLKACPKLNPDLETESHSCICYRKHKGSHIPKTLIPWKRQSTFIYYFISHHKRIIGFH